MKYSWEKYGALLLLAFMSLPGCLTKTAVKKLSPDGAGKVYFYLQPFPKEASRLTFRLQGISALKDDGTASPLTLTISELNTREVSRQRLLASAYLSKGRYNGLSFRVDKASLTVEEGEAALLVPEEPVEVGFPFDVKENQSKVIYLDFRFEQSIEGRIRLAPVFSIYLPDRPVTNLIGYVPNGNSKDITVIDKKRKEVVGAIATGEDPSAAVTSRFLGRSFVSLRGEDAVEVIDVTAGAPIKRIRLNTGDYPNDIALSPGGRVLLTANRGSDTVSVIDPVSLIQLDRINVGESPNSVLVDSRGRRAYVFNAFSNNISVIDIATRSVAAVIPTEPGPLRGSFSRRGDRLYVILSGTPYLLVFDPISLSLRERIYVGRGVSAISVDGKTDLIYLGIKDRPAVEVYDPSSFLPIDTIPTEAGVSYMAIDDEENNLLLVIPERNIVQVVNLISKRASSAIDVGDGPAWVTVVGER